MNNIVFHPKVFSSWIRHRSPLHINAFARSPVAKAHGIRKQHISNNPTDLIQQRFLSPKVFSCNYCTKKNPDYNQANDPSPHGHHPNINYDSNDKNINLKNNTIDKNIKNQDSNDKPKVKPSRFEKIKDSLRHMIEHYKNGGKLLAYNIKQCVFILKKSKLEGQKLTRRERRLLVRTLSDLFRLIPLTAFIVIPFAELALPFFLVLFPNMLPSTFADKAAKQKTKSKVMIEAEGLSSIMREALARKAKTLNDPELLGFLKKLKSGAGAITLDEIYQHSKIFEEELTIDGLERNQAQAMCRLVGIQPFGPEAILRHRLKNKLNEIKKDDILIHEEGVESLDEEELEEACRTRGIYWKSAISVLKRRLKDWLRLSVEENVPVSLLIFSRTLVFPNERLEQALTKSLSSIPTELLEDIEILNADIEDLIKEEEEKSTKNEKNPTTKELSDHLKESSPKEIVDENKNKEMNSGEHVKDMPNKN